MTALASKLTAHNTAPISKHDQLVSVQQIAVRDLLVDDGEYRIVGEIQHDSGVVKLFTENGVYAFSEDTKVYAYI